MYQLMFVYNVKNLNCKKNDYLLNLLDAPIILNSYKKFAVIENTNINTECLVDAYPKGDIIWFGPSNQRLSSFTHEKSFNNTVISSELQCKFFLSLFCLSLISIYCI